MVPGLQGAPGSQDPQRGRVFEKPGQTMDKLVLVLPSVCYFVLVHYPVSRLIFGLLWHPAILAVFYSSEAFFGCTITWNDTWMVHKSVQPMFFHSYWCVLSHFPVSRWIFGRIWQPTIMVHFDPKKWNFWTLPDLEWHLDDAQKCLAHLFQCLGCILNHFPLSRLFFSSIMASSYCGCSLPKKHPFLDPPGPGIAPGWCIKVSNTHFPID